MSNHWNTLRRRKISRRTMLGASAKAGVGAAGLALVGCGGDDDDDDEAVAEAPADEQAAEQADEQAAQAEPEEEEEQAAPAGLAAYDLEGKVTVGWDAGPGSLDPGTPAGGSGSGSSNSQTHFDGMFKLNAQGGAAQGGLLDWEFVDEGLGLLMTIPSEPRLFHSGDAITAEDVKFNWDRALGRAEYNPDFGGLAELPDIGDVTIVDASSVHLATPSPEVGLPPQAGGMQFYSKALIEENGDQWAAQNPIYGTGPFRFDGWTPDQEIHSVRNDDYWQPRLELENPSGATGLPYFKNLTTTWIPEPQARIAALEVGEIDFAGQIPWDLAKEFEGDEDFAIHTHSAARGLYVAFPKNKANNPLNPDEPNPFADKRVRIALNLAVNVQEIIDTIQTGREDFTYTLAVGQFGHHPEFPNVRWGFDPERAKALLAEAGYPDGFEMNIHHPSGLYTGVAQFMQAVANDLRDIGMTVNLFSEELNIYFESVENREQPNPFLFIEPANDPLFSIRLVTHSTGIFVHTNDGLPGSPGSDVTMEVDALAEQAYVEFDDAKREALLQELALKHYEDASWLYLFELIQPHVSTSRVLWPQFANKPGAIEYSNFRLLKA